MKKLAPVSIFWFRRDLRLHDNHALFKALQNSKNVLPIFIFDKNILEKLSDKNEKRVSCIHQVLENINQEIGSGMVGELSMEMDSKAFLSHLKSSLNLDVIKFTPFNEKIQKVAICGGSGRFLLNNAISSGADAFVSADFKYHEYFDAENKIMICDIGHYESEVATKELFYEVLSENMSNIALVFSETETNPIRYYK